MRAPCAGGGSAVNLGAQQPDQGAAGGLGRSAGTLGAESQAPAAPHCVCARSPAVGNFSRHGAFHRTM